MNILDQTNNRQTFAIVSWRTCKWILSWYWIDDILVSYVRDLSIDLRSRIVFWWMSSFYSNFFCYYGLEERRCQLNGRSSTSFRYCRSEGEWKQRRTIVQLEEREWIYEKDTSTDSQVAIFPCCCPALDLCAWREEAEEEKRYHHSQRSIFYRSHNFKCCCLRNRIVYKRWNKHLSHSFLNVTTFNAYLYICI